MKQTEMRKLNDAIERVIGPPKFCKERVPREVFRKPTGRRFTECHLGRHSACPTNSGVWFCDCACHGR